jgi:hypothetical protein
VHASAVCEIKRATYRIGPISVVSACDERLTTSASGCPCQAAIIGSLGLGHLKLVVSAYARQDRALGASLDPNFFFGKMAL